MRIYPTTIKRITTVISGVNWLARVKPAVRIGARATMVMPERPAVALEQSPSTLLTRERPALRFALAPFEAKAAQKPAPKLGAAPALLVAPEKPAARLAAAASTMKVPEKPAANIVQVEFDLEHKSFVVTMTNDAGNARDWTTPANAQGANDGVNAVWSVAVAIAQAGKMHGTTVAQVARPASLVIDEVWLALWGSYSGLPVVDDLFSGLTVGYRIGGLPALDITTHTRRVGSGSDAGVEVRLNRTGADSGKFTDGSTAALSTDVTWANIALLQFWGGAQVLAGITPTFNIDALRLRVIAHEVWAL